MGYANSLPYQEITLFSRPTSSSFIVSTAESNKTGENLSIPNFKNPISHAYFDIIISGCKNTFADVNHLVQNGSFGLETHGFTYYAAGSCYDYYVWTNTSASWTGTFIIPGTTDLVSSLSPGTDYYVYLYKWKAAHDNLELYGIYGRLRLYFAV